MPDQMFWIILGLTIVGYFVSQKGGNSLLRIAGTVVFAASALTLIFLIPTGGALGFAQALLTIGVFILGGVMIAKVDGAIFTILGIIVGGVGVVALWNWLPQSWKDGIGGAGLTILGGLQRGLEFIGSLVG